MYVYETGFQSVAQSAFRLVTILLPQSLKCWDYRHKTLCPVNKTPLKTKEAKRTSQRKLQYLKMS